MTIEKDTTNGFIDGLVMTLDDKLKENLNSMRSSKAFNDLGLTRLGKNLDIMYWVAVHRVAEKHRKELMKEY